jgi:NADPH:quinone reductase-like Zn-dependent oxidoreductase
MNAMVFDAVGQPLRWEERPDLEPASGQVVVHLKAAALNRRDYWITQGMYPGIKTPVILGSDGAGVVARVGAQVASNWQNREVILNPALDWGDNPAAQGNRFQILGMPRDGTLATQIVISADYLYPKPAHLGWHEAAALPLGGLTAHRALFWQGELKEGQQILITGIGGGVATLALQFAVAAGAKVLVTSSSAAKIERAKSLGAIAGFDYTTSEWAERLQAQYGPLDLILDSAGGDGYARLIDLAAPGGRIVNFGVTAGAPKRFDLFKVFWKQLHLVGSTMGSPRDFQAMLDLVNQHKIQPIVDRVYPLGEANQALERMKNFQQFGKLVLEVGAA